ncbi:MAG: YjgP/YjgQ family permease [Cyanobacteria bacterium SIG30]|nr:YjgP/YjgQ family permease [Cyanobacteria bacterium SIG30]
MKKFQIPIIDKYIFTQVFQVTLVCMFLFVIVWIAPEILVKIIRQIFIDHIGLVQAGWNLFYELPKVFNMVLPIVTLIGCVFTFDTLSKNSELIIMRSSGISFTRLMMPAVVLSIFFMFACFFIGDKLVPFASVATKEDAHYNEHFVYVVKNEDNTPKQGIIISNYTPGHIKNLTIVNFSKNEYQDIVKFDSILTAPYALKFDDKWVLPVAKKYQIDDEGIYKNIETIKNYEILTKNNSDEVHQLMKNATKRERGFTGKQLKEYNQLLKKHDYIDEYNYTLTKYYQRFIHPLTCVLFAIIGCLLGYSPPRSQRMLGMLIAAAILFAYYITLPFFDVLAEKGVLPPIVTALFPIVAFICIIFAVKKVKDL